MSLSRPLLLLVIVLAALIGTPAARALDPDKSFHHFVQDTWSIEDGLPQITVRAITQDRDGYLWFGTQLGVARFDGVHFTAFNADNAPELPGFYIGALLADPDGRVWIGTYKGLGVYEHGHFRAIAADEPVGSLDIQSIVRTAGGEILVGTPQGVFAVQDEHLVRRYALPGPAQVLWLDSDALWVGSQGGAYRISRDQTTFVPLPDDASSATIGQLTLANGRLWAGSTAGLFSLIEGRWQRYEADAELAHSPIEEVFLDHDNNLWVAMIDHLARLRDGEVREIIHREPAGLAIRSAFEDREGNLWLGGQWDGVTRLWNGWTRRFSTHEGLDDPIVWSVAPGLHGEKWVGTETGLSRFINGKFELVVPGNQLPHPNAYTLLAEPGRVWIGTRRGVAVLSDTEGLLLPPELAPMANAQINGIVRDRQGALWFTTTQGLFRLFNGLLVRFGEAEGLTDARTRIFYQTSTGRRLIGGQGGLFEFADEHLLPVGLDSGLSLDLDVTSIHELPDGRLLIGTFAEGLHLLDSGRWVNLSRAGALPGYTPFFITDDGAGYIWVAGIRGIYRVALADVEAMLAGTTAGVSGEMLLNERGDRRGGQKGYCCNGAGNAKGLIENGVLWLPSRDGVVALSTAEVMRNPVVPNVRIERVKVNGQWREADPAGDWNLPQDARDLGFEFTTLSFQDPGSVDMRYRLRGYDSDWRTLDDPNHRQAAYTNLPPGNYVFEVSGSNNFGVWSTAPATFALRIQPRFHETALFLVMLMLFLASVVYGGYRHQLSSHRRQRGALEQLVRQRTEALEVSNRRLEEASQIDPVTGLRNRRFMTNQLPTDIAYYERERSRTEQGPETLVFALVEVDQFEPIRRLSGDELANLLMQQMAGVISRWLRNGDYIARWSDSEFLLVFRPLPSQHMASLGHRLCHAVNQHAFEPGPGQATALSCSIGLIECPLFREARGRLGWEQFVELAAGAKRLVQTYGGNDWAALRPKPGRDADGLRALVMGDLEQAIRNDQLDLMCSDHLRSTLNTATVAP